MNEEKRNLKKIREFCVGSVNVHPDCSGEDFELALELTKNYAKRWYCPEYAAKFTADT